jgi:predicted molibdopterin-dependent oxidoreductase YjgC
LSERLAFFATSKGVTNETYYAFNKAARLLGTNHVDLCARLCHAAQDAPPFTLDRCVINR